MSSEWKEIHDFSAYEWSVGETWATRQTANTIPDAPDLTLSESVMELVEPVSVRRLSIVKPIGETVLGQDNMIDINAPQAPAIEVVAELDTALERIRSQLPRLRDDRFFVLHAVNGASAATRNLNARYSAAAQSLTKVRHADEQLRAPIKMVTQEVDRLAREFDTVQARVGKQEEARTKKQATYDEQLQATATELRRLEAKHRAGTWLLEDAETYKLLRQRRELLPRARMTAVSRLDSVLLTTYGEQVDVKLDLDTARSRYNELEEQQQLVDRSRVAYQATLYDTNERLQRMTSKVAELEQLMQSNYSSAELRAMCSRLLRADDWLQLEEAQQDQPDEANEQMIAGRALRNAVSELHGRAEQGIATRQKTKTKATTWVPLKRSV